MTHLENIEALDTELQRIRYVHRLSPAEVADFISEWSDDEAAIIEHWNTFRTILSMCLYFEVEE